jgi:hypothetical protein
MELIVPKSPNEGIFGAVAELFELKEGKVAINCLRGGKRFHINNPSKIDFI